MKLKFLFLTIFILSRLSAQPMPNQYLSIDQKDSLYYLLTDNTLFKFSSHEASGEFYLVKYIEKNFHTSATLMLNDEYLFISYQDSIFYYFNQNPWDLNYLNVFRPGFPVTSLHNFGPYFIIRSGDIYHLYEINEGIIVPVVDSLFSHPSQELVFFTYPYVVIARTVYKYVEGFDFYAITRVGCGNTKTGMHENKLICHFYYAPQFPPAICNLNIHTIKEPDFPSTTLVNWGIDIPEIHTLSGKLNPKTNLYYFYHIGNVILTKEGSVAYYPSAADIVNITDNYIFLLGDSIKFSKWNDGSKFYPFTWTDLTSANFDQKVTQSFVLSQNYPNPFNPSTKISWQSPVSGRQVIKVFDVLGNEVAALVDEYKPAGSYEVEFSANNLPSGVYLYVLKSGNYFSSKKMIFLK